MPPNHEKPRSKKSSRSLSKNNKQKKTKVDEHNLLDLKFPTSFYTNEYPSADSYNHMLSIADDSSFSKKQIEAADNDENEFSFAN